MRRITIILLACFAITIFLGCAKEPQRVGFLSDYTKLEAESKVSYKYVASDEVMRKYKTFIVEPVEIRIYGGSDSEAKLEKGKITKEDLTDMRNYMHDALVNALAEDYELAYRDGPNVARMRIAITDINKSKPLLNILPPAKVSGAGLGGVSMEAELLDSQSNQQIAAIVESQIGSRLSFAGVTSWGDAKEVMDKWAKNFTKRLDTVHNK